MCTKITFFCLLLWSSASYSFLLYEPGDFAGLDEKTKEAWVQAMCATTYSIGLDRRGELIMNFSINLPQDSSIAGAKKEEQKKGMLQTQQPIELDSGKKALATKKAKQKN